MPKVPEVDLQKIDGEIKRMQGTLEKHKHSNKIGYLEKKVIPVMVEEESTPIKTKKWL